MTQQVRLDRLLSNLGYGSRREMGALAAAGGVILDGQPVRKGDQKVPVVRDLPSRMTVRGKPVDPPPGMALMLNKPLGVTCSHKEAGAVVYELLPPRWRARDPVLSTVGRLDKDTSGLLLITDDGLLLHQIISPRSAVAKRYHVTLARPMDGTEAAVFAAGTLVLDSEDKPLLPAELEVHSPTTAHLTLHEGRYHQVRRMFAAVGNHVEALHRDRVGALDLPADLEPGQWRIMSDADIAAVFSEAAA
ncbi:MAG: pseudouridine synthase [Caulobacter sp.]|nr:pseudouridine synthase [Caulobacter sp.]